MAAKLSRVIAYANNNPSRIFCTSIGSPRPPHLPCHKAWLCHCCHGDFMAASRSSAIILVLVKANCLQGWVKHRASLIAWHSFTYTNEVHLVLLLHVIDSRIFNPGYTTRTDMPAILLAWHRHGTRQRHGSHSVMAGEGGSSRRQCHHKCGAQFNGNVSALLLP